MTSQCSDVAPNLVTHIGRTHIFVIKTAFKMLETPGNEINIHSYIIKGLLYWYWWILSLDGISTNVRKLVSFDIPTWDNIHQFQCNNPLLFPNRHITLKQHCFNVDLTLALLQGCVPAWLFLSSPSFGASGSLCFVIMVFSGYPSIFFYIRRALLYCIASTIPF